MYHMLIEKKKQMHARQNRKMQARYCWLRSQKGDAQLHGDLNI